MGGRYVFIISINVVVVVVVVVMLYFFHSSSSILFCSNLIIVVAIIHSIHSLILVRSNRFRCRSD